MPKTPALRFETTSPAETEALAAKLARAITGGMVLLLSGELGSGKTVFVRGLLCGLDAGPDVAVTSPTYVLQHTYRGARHTLHHIDAYRLGGGAAEFESSGLFECLDDPAALVAVEWPERVDEFAWPAERIVVQLEHAGRERRRITLTPIGPRARRALARLKQSKKAKGKRKT